MGIFYFCATMSKTALNLIAISVFAMTLSVLLGPLINLSPAVVAIATFTVLGLATLDSFTWQGQGATLLLDWLANLDQKHRDRVEPHARPAGASGVSGLRSAECSHCAPRSTG